jgi:hypothetical protein
MTARTPKATPFDHAMYGVLIGECPEAQLRANGMNINTVVESWTAQPNFIARSQALAAKHGVDEVLLVSNIVNVVCDAYYDLHVRA